MNGSFVRGAGRQSDFEEDNYYRKQVRAEGSGSETG